MINPINPHDSQPLTAEPVIFDRQPISMKLEPGTYYWCSCGRSDTQPFCSGAHSTTALTPVAFEVDSAPKKVALCLCKHTKNPPFCDGSHQELP